MIGVPVLVTGAAGFIGRHLVRRLADEGYRVRAVDVHPARGGADGVEWVGADIRDAARLRELLEGVDTVFHLASVHLEVHAGEAHFEQVNVAAAAGLAALCAEAGVRRLVHTSSVGIFGHVQRPPAGEDAPTRPETSYERTKLAGERAVIERARQLGLDVVVLRPAWVFGVGCRRTAKLLRSVRKGTFFFIGGGNNLRHPIHISDMLDAFLLAAQAAPSAEPRVYNIAGPTAVTLREMVETVAAVQGVRPPRVRVPRGIGWMAGMAAETVFRPLRREPPFSRRSLSFFFNDNAFSTAAAERDLGFRPRVGLEAGLRLTLAGATA
jgi:nucleoside-diphosphate-sugar epimerase